MLSFISNFFFFFLFQFNALLLINIKLYNLIQSQGVNTAL